MVKRLWAGVFFVFLLLLTPAYAATSKSLCAVYLSGIGCHNCAQTDPVLFLEWTKKYPNLYIFEYEIFKHEVANVVVKGDYFQNYSAEGRTGVPFIIFNEKLNAMGRINVAAFESTVKLADENPFPMATGGSVAFENLDVTKLPGKFNIWTKNRVLMSGTNAGEVDFHTLLTSLDVVSVLKNMSYEKASPLAVEISEGEITFQNAVLIGDWRFQWNDVAVATDGSSAVPTNHKKGSSNNGSIVFWFLATLMFVFVPVFFLGQRKVAKGGSQKIDWKARSRDVIITILSFVGLILFFVLAKNVSPEFLKTSGYSLPLPVFTLIVALVDSFNPCNMFALTGMLALLIATSASKARLYIVGLTFAGVVYVFYYLFMAAWMNVFNYLSFVTPLRMGIAIFSLIVGLINCKELFFFRKGVSLMVQDEHKGMLKKQMDKLKVVIQKGSLPMLLTSSVALAVLTSLVEIPCTAGLPIIYTKVLVGMGFQNSVTYYLYLALYNLIYVVPLLLIIGVFISTFRARPLTQRHVEILKFLSGLIMIVLGIVLLVNPALVGMAAK